jgi:hypothetical protein
LSDATSSSSRPRSCDRCCTSRRSPPRRRRHLQASRSRAVALRPIVSAGAPSSPPADRRPERSGRRDPGTLAARLTAGRQSLAW